MDAGAYSLTVSGLTSDNYTISYGPSATLTIARRMLDIAADPLALSTGTAIPALTYSMKGDGLVAGDSLWGSLDTSANAQSPVGRYAIGQGSLSVSANYRINFTPGWLQISPRMAADPAYPSPFLVKPVEQRMTKALDFGGTLGCKIAGQQMTAERKPAIISAEFCWR